MYGCRTRRCKLGVEASPHRSKAMGSQASRTATPEHLRRSARTKSVIWTYEDYTEDAPDDEQIRRAMTGLRVAVIDHARDYHHQLPIQCAPEEIEKVLVQERETFPYLSTTEFAHLLCDTRTRRSAITGFISHMVLKNISFYGVPKQTLLEPTAVRLIREFHVGDPNMKLTEGHGSLSSHFLRLN